MRDAMSMPAPGAIRLGGIVGSIALVAAFALLLAAMGRPLICPCGAVELWHGGANDGGTSQHVADWYSPSHVIHGFLFYGAGVLLFRALGRPLPLAAVLMAAIAIEGLWELVENSPAVIERYRATTVSDAYAGDSVLNSVFDIGFMIAGFVAARMLPTSLIVASAILMELVALAVIRDNLTLNVLMFLHPFDVILDWQAAR
jgi:hypothetical protein